MIILPLKVLLKIRIHFSISEHHKLLNLWSVFNLLEVRDQKIQYFGRNILFNQSVLFKRWLLEQIQKAIEVLLHQLLSYGLVSQGFAYFGHQVVRVYDGFNDYEFSKPYLKNGVVLDSMLRQVSLGESYNFEAKFERMQVWLEFLVLVVEPREKAQETQFQLFVSHHLEDDLGK